MRRHTVEYTPLPMVSTESKGFKEGDLVEFVGPQEDYLGAPRPGERGTLWLFDPFCDSWAVVWKDITGIHPVKWLRLVDSPEAPSSS